jgi:hypothetical protein
MTQSEIASAYYICQNILYIGKILKHTQKVWGNYKSLKSWDFNANIESCKIRYTMKHSQIKSKITNVHK